MHRIVINFLAFFFAFSFIYGQAIKDTQHIQQLKEYRNKADEYFAKNLNRFGLDQLRQYDRTLDILYKKETNDTLTAIERYFNKSGVAIQTENEMLSRKKEILLKNKEEFNSSYQHLITRFAVFVVGLAVFFLIVLIIWKRKLTKQQEEYEKYKLKLARAKKLADSGEMLIDSSTKKLIVYQQLKQLIQAFHNQEMEWQQKPNNEGKNESREDVKLYIKNINQQLNTETSLNSTILEFSNNKEEEKRQTDINKLCTAYFELVKDGIAQPEDQPEISASMDLEKNLPQIKVIPSAIGHLLIHILTNAIHSVQEKAGKSKKGYIPKITLSTRILPRFLQIRVHDNGEGIEDKYFNKIKDAFFTLKKEEDSGLGLFISNLIMKNHQGEIKIESDKTTGTDVYLKFYLS